MDLVMKNTSISPFLISAISAAIAGCSNWPDQGQGGDAQVDSSHEYYIEQVNTGIGQIGETKGALQTQWSIHSLKLDTLVLRGGQECLPARVREASMMAKRARRELDGNLLEDARNSLIVFHREVDELDRRLIYIKRHTECGQSSLHSSADMSLTAQQQYMNRKLFLLTLLNDDYCFDTDSDKVTAHYKEKLTIAGHYLIQDPSIRLYINGHADAHGDYSYNQELALRRAQKVQQVLVVSGVNIERLVLRSFGEQLPIETNESIIGRMKNRRVSIEFIESNQFYIPGSDGLLFEQNNNVFGFSINNEVSNKKSPDKAQHLKDWHEKMDEGYRHDY